MKSVGLVVSSQQQKPANFTTIPIMAIAVGVAIFATVAAHIIARVEDE
jgi:hypothetical protein